MNQLNGKHGYFKLSPVFMSNVCQHKFMTLAYHVYLTLQTYVGFERRKLEGSLVVSALKRQKRIVPNTLEYS